MRLETSDPGDCMHTQGGDFLPSVRRLPGDLQFLGNNRHVVIVAQAADRRINLRHRVILVS